MFSKEIHLQVKTWQIMFAIVALLLTVATGERSNRCRNGIVVIHHELSRETSELIEVDAGRVEPIPAGSPIHRLAGRLTGDQQAVVVGNLVFFLNSAGHLNILDTRTWTI